jgi:hypothetical protein
VVNWLFLLLGFALGALIMFLLMWLPRRRQPVRIPSAESPRESLPDDQPPADETPTGQIPVQTLEPSEADPTANREPGSRGGTSVASRSDAS